MCLSLLSTLYSFEVRVLLFFPYQNPKHYIMKHLFIISILLAFTPEILIAQTTESVASYNFANGFEGWTSVNDSEPSTDVTAFSAETWGLRSRYSSGSPTISDWIISPVLQLQANDQIEFQVAGSNGWSSSVEVRLSSDGATSTNPTPDNGNATTDVGDFTTVLFTGDPDDNFPNNGQWHIFTTNIPESDIPSGTTDFKIAIRHFDNTNNADFLDVGYLDITRMVDPPILDVDFRSNGDGIPSDWTRIDDSEPVAVNSFSAAGSGAESRWTSHGGTGGATAVSDWMVSPIVDLNVGDEITFVFYDIGPSFAELRLSTSGASSTLPTSGDGDATEVGDFNVLLLREDPDSGGSPVSRVITLDSSHLPSGETSCRIAIRHQGDNSADGIVVESIHIENNTMGVENEAFSQSLSMIYPNPTSNTFNLDIEYQGAIHLKIFNVTGALMSSFPNTKERKFDISYLKNNGTLFFVHIQRESGEVIGTKKLFLKE